MASTFFGLNIGKSGLYASQAALNTTAHNIANTETPGYSRQVVNQQASVALKTNNTYGMAGTGVDVTGVKQLRDEYYDVKYWTNNTVAGEYKSKYYYMTEIENCFNEISVEGFNSSYNSMYDSIQELSKNPSSLTVRTQVTTFAKTLTEYFNSMAQSMKRIQEDTNFEIKNRVEQINSIAQQIAALTKQINSLEVTGVVANDVRDQRALLVDELSEVVNVTVDENVIGNNVGVTTYIIKIDGKTLVDTAQYNTLQVIPREYKNNQNDIEGLYDVAWQNGQTFDLTSPSIGGALQALYQVRDGNNLHNLSGNVHGFAGEQFITLTDATINEVEKLNIPETGIITVGNREYTYTGFEVNIDESTGEFIYTFELEKPLTVNAIDVTASIGESINYKGIPYYMDQMNTFIRTYAKAFNDIHRNGKDLNDKAGIDFFNATHSISGRDYVFGPYKDSDDLEYYDYNYFNSGTGGYEEEILDDQPLYGSYYFMTASNFTVSKQLQDNPSLLAASSDTVNGVENNKVVSDLIALKMDKSLFKQGAAGSYMNTLVAEVGINAMKAKDMSAGQDNILAAIVNQRLSISGVDMDEETMNLIRFQNAYNLSAKVITVMDEIYDKLINYMGV